MARTTNAKLQNSALDLRCYFVTGNGNPQQIVETAKAAAAGGAGLIQVRSKPISARGLYELTARVAEEVASVSDARVLVDDRVDVAAALMQEGHSVHGVHIGQDDLPVPSARTVLGSDAIIGLTTGTLELIRSANQHAEILDYVGCGPFRDTPTKDSGRAPLRLDGFAPIVAESLVPVVAIGDVTSDDAADLAATGVDGLAIVRGIMNADDPEAYVREVLAGFEAGSCR